MLHVWCLTLCGAYTAFQVRAHGLHVQYPPSQTLQTAQLRAHARACTLRPCLPLPHSTSYSERRTVVEKRLAEMQEEAAKAATRRVKEAAETPAPLPPKGQEGFIPFYSELKGRG